MRRIKSAPANLCSMSNKKKPSNILEKPSPILLRPDYLKQSKSSNKIENNIINFNYKKNKNIKNSLSDIGEYISDFVTEIDEIPIEESTLISAIILYTSQNILKREKFKEIYKFLLKHIIRYIIIYYFHNFILHDNSQYLINLPDILLLTN